jgi:hypothetical protein
MSKTEMSRLYQSLFKKDFDGVVTIQDFEQILWYFSNRRTYTTNGTTIHRHHSTTSSESSPFGDIIDEDDESLAEGQSDGVRESFHFYDVYDYEAANSTHSAQPIGNVRDSTRSVESDTTEPRLQRSFSAQSKRSVSGPTSRTRQNTVHANDALVNPKMCSHDELVDFTNKIITAYAFQDARNDEIEYLLSVGPQQPLSRSRASTSKSVRIQAASPRVSQSGTPRSRVSSNASAAASRDGIAGGGMGDRSSTAPVYADGSHGGYDEGRGRASSTASVRLEANIQ